MNIDQDPARMIDSTEARTRVDRKRALAVFALAAIFSVGCGKHRGYDAPDAGGDESAEAGSGSTKTSESHTSAANGGARSTTTGAAGRQSTGSAGRTGNAGGSQRAAAGGGAAGHSASGSAKGGDGDDTNAEPQNAGGATAPAAEGGSGGVSATSGDGAAGTNAGAGGDLSSGGAGASDSGDVSTGGGGSGANATGDVGGAGATGEVGGAGAGATGDGDGARTGAGGVGGTDNAAGAGGAGAGGMSGGDSGGTPAAGGGGSSATCHHDRDCSDGLICNANSATCQHCSSDDDCQGDRHYGPGSSCAPDTRLCSGLCASCGGCEEVQIPNTDTHHTDDPIDYPDPPPTSGPHNPCWGTWGVHDMPLPDYRWVHNLEHGGIVFLYNCPDGCAADVATLSQLVMSHPRTVLTSYAKLPSRFAAVAWGHRLLTSCVDVMAFTDFYNENFDHGPESEDAQPDSSCPP